MKKRYWIVVIILSIFINIKSARAQNNYLLALGDSITTGYGLDNINDSYVNLFYNYLNRDVKNNFILNNYAVNGMSSLELLNFIKTNEEIISQIKQADIILISIGGNDYLHIISTYQIDYKIIRDTGNQLLNNMFNIYNTIFNHNHNVKIMVIPLYNPYLDTLNNISNLNKEYNLIQEKYIYQIERYKDEYNKNIYTSQKMVTILSNEANLNKGIDPHPNTIGHELLALECIEIYEQGFINDSVIEIENKKYTLYYVIGGLLVIILFIFKK